MRHYLYMTDATNTDRNNRFTVASLFTTEGGTSMGMTREKFLTQGDAMQAAAEETRWENTVKVFVHAPCVHLLATLEGDYA
jgi:hypothetical protein